MILFMMRYVLRQIWKHLAAFFVSFTYLNILLLNNTNDSTYKPFVLDETALQENGEPALTENGHLLSKSLYSLRMRESKNQKPFRIRTLFM